MAIGDIYAVKTRYFLGSSGKTVAPGFHIRQDDATPPNAATVTIKVQEMWDTVNSAFSADTRMDAVTMRRVSPIEPREEIVTTGFPIAGGGAAASDLAPGTAIVVSLRTDFIGRSYRGRHFMPAPAEAVSDGSLLIATADLIADAWNTLIAELSADDNPMVVFTQVAGRTPTEVTQALVDQRLRSQRRRQARNPTYSGG